MQSKETMGARTTKQPSRIPGSTLGAAGTAFLLFLLLAGLSAFAGWVFLQRTNRIYEETIYPNVYALGVHLGGMTPAQAATALDAVADQVDTGMLVLTDGDQQWSYPWTLGGLKVDTAGTANAAYAVGRGVSWREHLALLP